MRSKTLALLLVAVIASGIVLAVSAQSQITASDIAKAILPGGFVNPKAIMPGAIDMEHLSDAVKNAFYGNDTTTLSNAYSNDTQTLSYAYSNDTNTLSKAYINDTTTLSTAYNNDTQTLSSAYGNDTTTLSSAYTNDTTTLSTAISKLLVRTITVYNDTGNFSIGTDWTPILNTSSEDYVDGSGETVTPSVASAIIIIYSGNVTCAAGDIYVKCEIGNETDHKYYEAILDEHKVGDKLDCKVHFSVPFFYDGLVAGQIYNVTIFARATSTPSAIANQTLTAIVIPK